MSISMALTSQAVRLRARLQPWTPVEQLHGRRYPEPARIPADLRRSHAVVRTEVAGRPPVHVVQGGKDILAADVLAFARDLARAGNPGKLIYEPGAFHVYVGAWWTPEARRALAHVRFLLTGPGTVR